MPSELKHVLAVGENVAVEFKRAGNGIHADAYECICALLNRFGGDVYFGVRKMFMYGKSFAGSDPTLTEGDLFCNEFSLCSDLFNTDWKSHVPINEPIKDKVRGVVLRNLGINRERFAKELQVDVKTIGRAIAALAGVVGDRGCKKTGGYYCVGEGGNNA